MKIRKPKLTLAERLYLPAIVRGLVLTFRHLLRRKVTLQYPEVFLTGTAAEVTPVGRIDDHAYTPGRITQTLLEDYENLVGKAEAGKKASAA